MMSKKRIPESGENETKPKRVSLAGYLAIAATGNQDPVLGRSVCIIVEHSDERAVGIMLNRRLAIKTAGIWDELLKGEAQAVNPASYINFGGPLDGPLLAIHDHEQLAEGGNNQGVFLSAQSETLKKLALVAPEHCRLFIGNVVWPHSKLERDIVDGKTHVLPAVPELVFAEEQSMWQLAIQTVGNGIVASAPGITGLMQKPELN
jgi:putative transcriptional regulator